MKILKYVNMRIDDYKIHSVYVSLFPNRHCFCRSQYQALVSIRIGTCNSIGSALDPEVAEFARRLKLIETCAVKSLFALAEELDQEEEERIEAARKKQSTNMEDSVTDSQLNPITRGQVIVCVEGVPKLLARFCMTDFRIE